MEGVQNKGLVDDILDLVMFVIGPKAKDGVEYKYDKQDIIKILDNRFGKTNYLLKNYYVGENKIRIGFRMYNSKWKQLKKVYKYYVVEREDTSLVNFYIVTKNKYLDKDYTYEKAVIDFYNNDFKLQKKLLNEDAYENINKI